MSSARPDFSAVRRECRFEAVLHHYGYRPIGRGGQVFIPCPFHDERTPSCSIHLDKRVFHCFGCGVKGTIIDFVARIERVDIQNAAAKIIEWCGEPASLELPARVELERMPGVHAGGEQTGDNSPLRYRLMLDPAHPYLTGRGLTAETVTLFGLGYCHHGLMRGRICIPIHDGLGRLVAYAGRWAADPVPHGTPRYLLPRAFRKGFLLFNLHRVPQGSDIVLVEGFWSVFRLHTLGIPVASLMGSSATAQQIDLLEDRLFRRVTILMDGDKAGYRIRTELLDKLATRFWVRAPVLGPGAKPDMIPEAELREWSLSN